MATDWIKMRTCLQTHPKIVRILSAIRPHDVQTTTDKLRVIGGLHAVWSVFDAHSEDGVLYGYTPKILDEIIGWSGFSDAMIHVKWLMFDGNETMQCPDFQEHNGKSGKRRAEDQKRKRSERSCPQNVRKMSAEEPDKKRTREEKRREELTPTDFVSFWNAYPRKVAKPAALKAWRKLAPDAQTLASMLAAIKRELGAEQWQRDNGSFIPHPATWLNNRRWEDAPSVVVGTICNARAGAL